MKKILIALILVASTTASLAKDPMVPVPRQLTQKETMIEAIRQAQELADKLRQQDRLAHDSGEDISDIPEISTKNAGQPANGNSSRSAGADR